MLLELQAIIASASFWLWQHCLGELFPFAVRLNKAYVEMVVASIIRAAD